MTDQAKEPTVNEEQARLLASVTGVDQQLEPDAAPGAAPGKATVNGQPAEIEDPVQELADALQLVIDTVAAALPFIPEIYSPKVIKQHAIAINAVATKYGWDLKTNLGPELGLALVALPPAISSFVIGRAYIAQMRQQAQAGDQGAGTDGHP